MRLTREASGSNRDHQACQRCAHPQPEGGALAGRYNQLAREDGQEPSCHRFTRLAKDGNRRSGEPQVFAASTSVCDWPGLVKGRRLGSDETVVAQGRNDHGPLTVPEGLSNSNDSRVPQTVKCRA